LKYVYYREGKEYADKPWYAQIYDPTTQKVRTIGTYATVAEAHYAQITEEHGHHWEGMPTVIPDDIFGFTYKMTHRATGRMYLGAKQLYFWDGPTGGWKVSDPRDPEFDRELWVESDWRDYCGSSKITKAMVAKEGPHAFTYEITQLHHDKLGIFHGELVEQMEADVLNAVDEDGNYVYLNEQIMGVEYRPKAPRAKVLQMRDSSAQDMRNYYLNPRLCEDCGSVIPFGESQCPGKPVFGNGGCTHERAANGTNN